MAQVQLPIFPTGVTHLSPEIAFEKRDGRVVYFNGHLPVFMHAVEDLGAFRLFTSQLIVNGTVSQGQIVEAFGVPLVTVKRCVKRWREQGAGAFFKPGPRRVGSKLTPERLGRAQSLLDAGRSVPEISREIGVLPSTLHKAIDDGRLRQGIKKKRKRIERGGAEQKPAQPSRRAGAAGGGHHPDLGTGDGRDRVAERGAD
jgi:transposase-like protein